MDAPEITTIGTSHAMIEAEAAWFVEQGQSVEDVAAWIDEPAQFVRNAINDPEAGSWLCWSKGGWERRRIVIDDHLPTPSEIRERAAEIECGWTDEVRAQRWGGIIPRSSCH